MDSSNNQSSQPSPTSTWPNTPAVPNPVDANPPLTQPDINSTLTNPSAPQDPFTSATSSNTPSDPAFPTADTTVPGPSLNPSTPLPSYPLAEQPPVPTWPAPSPTSSYPTFPDPTSSAIPTGSIPVSPTMSDLTPAQNPLEPLTPSPPQPAQNPLDNPYGSSMQSSTPQTSLEHPSWMPSPALPTSSSPLSPGSLPQEPTPTGIMTPPADQAPTDLSHLISNTETSTPDNPANSAGAGNAESAQSAITQAETLVVPANPSPEVPTIPTETKTGGGFPKWIIGLGAGLLLLVAGASAYFILGIGQNKAGTTSLPASQTPAKTGTIQTPPPVVTTPKPEVSPTPTSSGSANFGQLQGSSTTSTSQASSAADILRARQQQSR